MIINVELRSEILAMVAEDQKMRAAWVNGIATAFEDVDQKNTARMKEIVAKFGWPGASLVGTDGAQAAWLLVQHADLDPAFQKLCLGKMQEALRKGEVDGKNVAYLVDRVAVNEGRKQVYGTQFGGEGADMAPRPIEDPEHVDERRRALGMPSMKEYADIMRETYDRK